MEDLITDDFVSFMVFIFKALFLKTLKFQLCRYFSLRRVDEFSWNKEQIFHNILFISFRISYIYNIF